MPEWYVYILKSLTSKFHYVGSTNNLERRLREHNEGLSQSTKAHRPFKIEAFVAVETECVRSFKIMGKPFFVRGGFSAFRSPVFLNHMILVIDNYDSFTFNLVQLLQSILEESRNQVVVKRNDEIVLSDIAAMNPERILLSPGPGRPEDAGITISVVKKFGLSTPILGVCLGHQAIVAAFGGRIIQARSLMHGMTSEISHRNTSVFKNLKNPFIATRYHSLAVAEEGLPAELVVTARANDGEIMGIQHKSKRIAGVQFHPESILTEEGEKLLRNWLAP